MKVNGVSRQYLGISRDCGIFLVSYLSQLSFVSLLFTLKINTAIAITALQVEMVYQQNGI